MNSPQFLLHRSPNAVSGIALAHAFVGGNKRTARRAVRLFLRLNGYMLERESLEFANAILALVNRTDSLEATTD